MHLLNGMPFAQLHVLLTFFILISQNTKKKNVERLCMEEASGRKTVIASVSDEEEAKEKDKTCT